MKNIVVGLGNYPKEYYGTRHNVGFLALDNYAKTKKINFKENMKNSETFEIKETIFCKPLTLMNLSGEAVLEILTKNKKVSNIFVIYDDINIPCGKFKIKNTGNGGGHNGISNIIDKVGNKNITKIKIGVGLKNKNDDMVKFVLGKPNTEDQNKINSVLPTINEIIDSIVSGLSPEEIMNKYNG